MIIFDLFVLLACIYAKISGIQYEFLVNTILLTVCIELAVYFIRWIIEYRKERLKFKLVKENLEELKKYNDDIERMLKEIGSWTDKDEEDDMR